MKIENFKLEERVLFEAGAVIQAAEAAAADQANNDAAGAGETGAADGAESESTELESLAEMPVPPEMAGSDNADDSADADADGNAAADPESDAGSNAISFLDAPISEAASETSERILVVLNSSVADADSIIAGLGENVEVLKLTAGTDALDSINDYLDAHADTEYSAIHIVSHGNEGYISLNGERIDAATLNPADWKAIGEHLSDDADILIYGCDTAKSDEGKALVQSIADLTGADVAASTDSTGANGDWDLEYRSGLIEAATLAPESYRYDLEAKTFIVDGIGTDADDTDSTYYFKTLTAAITQANTDGGEIEISFGMNSAYTEARTSTLSITNTSLNLTINGWIDLDNDSTVDEGERVVFNGKGNQILNTTGGNITIENIEFLDGCTASNGKGGTIYNDGAVITVKNSVVRNKGYDTVNGTSAQGGVLYNKSGHVTFENTLFSGEDSTRVKATGVLFYVAGGTVDVISSTIYGSGSDAYRGKDGAGHTITVASGATLNIISSTSYTNESSSASSNGWYAISNSGTLNVINSILGTYSGTVVKQSTVTNNLYSSFLSYWGGFEHLPFSEADGTFVFDAGHEFATSGTLVGKLNGDLYYLDYSDPQNKVWKQVGGSTTCAFDAADTASYGLSLTTDEGESIFGTVFTASQNGVSRVETLDAFNKGAYAHKAHSNSTVINSSADDVTGSNPFVNSLREAIAYAETLDGEQTITFADGVTIVYLDADLNINKSITIDGGTADRIVNGDYPEESAKLSETMATGVCINVAIGGNDSTITLANGVTLTVDNYLTISRWHGMEKDGEVQTSDDIKPQVNLTGGNVTINQDAKLTVYDNFETGTLINNGSLLLSGEKNAFSAADGGDFGNVTYVALHHSAKSAVDFVEVDIADPNIVAGTYKTLSVYSADLIRYEGWNRVPWYYGSTVANSRDGGTLYSQALATLTANGNVTAENLILGNGVTLKVTGAVDAENTTVGTSDTLTNIAEANRHWGALNVSGNFDGGTITNYGTLTLSGANNTGSGTLGDVTYKGADGQTIISGTYNNLTIATTGTATATGDITATVTTIGASSVLDADGDLAAGTLTNSGSIAVGGTFSAAGENFGNVTYDGAEAQNIFGGTYSNLILSGGDKTLSDAVTVTGELTAGVKINAAYDLTLSGTVSGTGTVAATAGTITYNGTDQTVLAGTYHNLTLTGTTIEDVKTLAGAVTANGEFSATNTTITRGEAAENVSLTLSDAGNDTTPSTLISGVNFNGISVTNTIADGDGNLYLNQVNNTADANSTGIKFVFDADITVEAITYGQTLGEIVITAKNNLGEPILTGTVAELGWKWQLLDGTAVDNSTVLNVTAGTEYNLFTNTDSSVGSQNVVVNKKTLTITAQGISKVYGQTDKEAEGTCYTVVSGLVNGDTAESIGLNVTWVRGENGAGEDVILKDDGTYGGYAITISGTITSGNYNLVYAEQNAVLTITPKILSYGAELTGEFTAREYDGTSDVGAGNITLSHTGIIDADKGTYSVGWDSAKYYNQEAETETANAGVGTYRVTVEGLKIVDSDGNVNNNYVFERTNRNFINLSDMIVAKNVEVVANGNGSSITYGESPDLTYTVYEYTPGEGGEAGTRGEQWTLNDLTGKLDVSEYTNPGTDQSTTATITQGTLTNENNPNYNITFTGGDFTVNGRAAETKSLTVTTAEDVENDSDDKISLREAILYAAQDAAAVANGDLTESALAVNGVYTITFGNEVTTITVTSALMIKANAFAGEGVELVINGDGKVTLSGNGTSQILNIAAGNDVTVNGITFTQGYSADAHGGAVYNRGKLTITDSAFTGNSTAKSGGAIKNEGVMVIIDSTFTSNTTTSYGGAIYNTSDLTITGSTFTSNTSNNFGGAISNTDDLTITGSTFTKNVAKHGGAIWNSGTVQVTDAVFTDNTLSNSSGKGGNLYNSAGSTVLERTLFKANNTARLNGVGTLFYVAGGTVDVIESTVYGSTATGSGGYSYGFHGANTNGHVVTITSGATLNMINSTAYTAVYAGGTSDTYKKFAYDVISGGTFNVINSIITTHRSGAHYGSYAINGSYNNYSSLVGSNAFESFSSTTNTFALKADSEASGGGTLVGKLDGSYYYLTKDADGDRIWQQVGGDRHYDFDAADTTNYGLKYTGTDPETGSESVITGLVYTTALNGVSRVLTLDTFNMGSHALTPVDPATVGSLTVTTAYDTSFANSLRVVLAYAETLDGEQTITFADGITIVYLHNDLNINKSVTIDGGTTPRIVSGDYPEESAKLSETMATGVCINVAIGGNDSTITLKDGVTLTVDNYLTISRWHGMEEDGEVETSNAIKPQVNLTGGNVTIKQGAKLTVYDNFETGTLINNGSLFLSGEKNAFSAADGGDFGNVTYVALHHSAKPNAVGGPFLEVEIADPNIVAGTYKTLSVYSADLIRYQGWSRVPWFYGSTVAYSMDTKNGGGTLYSQALATLTANGNVTAEHLIIGDGVTLKIAANGDATQKGDLTVTGTTTVGSSEDYDGITDPVRGTLIVEGNITAATLTNIGGITVGGDFTATAENYGKVTYKGNADQKVSAGTYTDLVIETAGTATAAGSVTADTTTVDETATFDVDGDLSAGTLTNNGTIALSGSLDGTLNGTSWGNVTYDGTEQTILAGTYGNLTLSGEGAKTLAGAIVVNGDFTANAAFSTAGDLALHGAVSGTGTINATAGTVTYDLDSTEKVQVILAGTYYNLALSGGSKILTSATVSNTFSASNTKLQKADDAVSNATLTLKSSATTGTSSTPSSTISGVTFNGISVTDGEGDAAPLYVDALTNIVPEGNENIETVIGATITLGNPGDTDYSIDYGTALGNVVVTITYLNGEKQTGTVSELGWNWEIGDDTDNNDNDAIVDATAGTVYHLIAPSGNTVEVTLKVNRLQKTITVNTYRDVVDDGSNQAGFDFTGEDYSSMIKGTDGRTSFREAINRVNALGKNIDFTITFGKMEDGEYAGDVRNYVTLSGDIAFQYSFTIQAVDYTNANTVGYVENGNLVLDYGSMFKGVSATDYATKGVWIIIGSGADAQDAKISMTEGVTLTVNGNLTISRFAGYDNDSEITKASTDENGNPVMEWTKPELDLSGGNISISEGSILTVFDDFNIGTLDNAGKLYLYGNSNTFSAAADKTFGDVTYVALGLRQATAENNTDYVFSNPTVQTGTYSTLSFESAELFKSGWSRRVWLYGDSAYSEPAKTTFTSAFNGSFVASGGVTAATTNLSTGATLNVDGNFNGGTLTNNGTLILSGAENAATGTLGNVIYDGTETQKVIAGNYGKLTLENGTKVMSSTTATKVGLNFTATDTTIQSDSSSLASLTVIDAGTATSASTAVRGVRFENMAVVNTANTENLLHVSILNNATDEATTGVNLVSTSVDDLTFTYGTELGDVAITIRNGAGDEISSGQTLKELGWSLQKADAEAEGGFVTLDYGTILNVAESGTYWIKTASGYTEEVKITVNKATVTIKADNASKTYGEADPEQFTYQAPVGLVGTDTVTVSLNRATGENAGTYAITITATIENGDSNNYEIDPENGTFTINRKAITVTPNADQSVSNAGSFTYKVTDADGNPLTVTLSGALGFDEVTHMITQGTLTNANNKNYSITFTSGVAVGTEAKSLTVTTTEDIVDAYDGKISLREAIKYANADAAALAEGTITVSELADANGIYTISFADFGKDMYGAPYLRVYLNADNGALNINTNITIDGGTADRITSKDYPQDAAALSASVARGIIISAADSTSAETRKDVEIKIADGATLTVENYLTISHWHGMAGDEEVETSDDIKSRVNLTGGNVTVSENAKLSVYDSFEIGTLVNNGSLFLYGEKNAFSAADAGDFGNVTYVALHHSAKSAVGFSEVNIADPNIVAGTYKTLSVYSADLIRYQGWSRVPWYYGSTVTNSRDGGTLYSQTLATLTANGNVTAQNLIIGDGVTLNIMENLDADKTTIGSTDTYTGISTPVRGALSVSGNFDGGTITNNGTLTLSGAKNAGSGTLGDVTYKGADGQTIISGTYGDLTIETAGTAMAEGAVTADTTTVKANATLDANGDLTAGALTNSGTVKVAGAFSATAENFGNVTYDGTEQTILAGTYGNLTLENGTKTLSSATVNYTFTAANTTLQKAVDAGSNATLTLMSSATTGTSTEPSGTVSNTAFNGISVTNTAGDGNLYVNAKGGNSVDDASERIVLVGLTSITVGGYGTDSTLNATYGETLTLTETKKEVTVNIDGEDVTLYLDVTWKTSDLSGNMSSSGFVNAGTYNGVLTVDTVKAYTKEGEVYTEVTNRYAWDKSVTSDLVIDKATITVSGITANGKTYDGKEAAEIVTSGADLEGNVEGDDLTITATGAFADANAGANKAVTGTFELTGADAANYTLADNTFSTTATITAKEVTLAWEKADSYTYTGADQSGTVKATYTDVDGKTQYVDVTFDKTFQNVGDYTATAAAVANYSFTNATQSLKINKLALTVTGASETVTYDGTAHTLNSVTPGTTSVNGHTVSTTATVTGTDVGEYDLNIANAVIVKDANGNDVTANYEITTNNGKLTINKALLTVTLQDATVTYGNADPELTYSVGGIVDGSDGADLADVTLSREAGTDVGKYLISATATSKSGNYDVDVADTAAYLTITAKEISIDSVTLADKTYDGNTSATITGATVSGVVGSDEVTVDFSSANAAFTNANAGAAVSFQASGFTLTGADAGNYKLTETPFDGTAEINKAKIIISNIVAANREYNGETGAVVTFGKSGILDVDTDKVTLSVTGTFDNKNVGTGKTVDLVWSLTGEAKDNYELSGNLTETTADITAKKITVTAEDVTATYGQDYTLTHTGALLGSDTFTGALEVQNAAYNSTGSHLKADSYTIGQGNLSAGANYDITFVDGTLTIDKAALSVATMTATDRAYNGTMAVELNGYTFNGLVGADAVTLTATGTAASRNAGTQNVTFSNLAIDGADKDNYTFNAAAPAGTVSVVISKAAISITANNASKVYNTADPALGYTVTAGELFADDSIALSREAGDEVGTYAINGCTITDGNNGENYAVTFTPGIFTIANKAATITVGTTTLTYNGAAQAATEYTVEGLEDGHKVSSITLTGATDAGSYDATVESITITDANDNDVTSQYGLTYVAGKLNINKATITISDIVAANREYNGGTGADVTFKESGILAVDTDKVTLSVTGAFDNKNVGTGKTVDLVWSLTGEAADNYVLADASQKTTADITAKKITISGIITAADKTYDGNDTTTVNKSAASLTGNVAGDNLDFTVTGAFADADAGENKTVNLTVTLTGADKGNYVLAAETQKTATATINKAQITISGITANSKTYDGNTTATLDYSKVVFGGIFGDDKLTVTATGAFESASAGTGKNVEISGLTLGGESLANYVLAATGNQSSTTATINKAALTVTAKDAAITYGEDHSSILSSSYTVTGMVNGEAASVVTGAMGIENATNLSGAGKLKADANDLYKFTLGTLTAANYDITFVAEDGTDVKALTVNKLDLSATVNFATSKVYNGNTAVTVNSSSLDTVLTNDTVNFNAVLVYNDANVANANKIVSQTWEITGADAANYNLAAFTETTGTITAKSVELAWSSAGVTYTYNGDVQSVTATYTDVNGATQNADVSFGDGITFKNEGDYTATAAAVANYSFTNATQSLKINKLALTVTGASETVTYDGNAHTLDSVTPGDTIVQGHTVSTTATVTGTDAGVYDLNIANTVIVTDAEGNDVTANYEITTNNGKLTINKKMLSVDDIEANITAQTYDGDTTLDSATLTIDGVSVSWTNAAFNSADVATATEATFSGLTVDSNYALSADTVTVNAAGKILAKEISLGGLTVADKVYDGTKVAEITGIGFAEGAIIFGDTVTVDTTGATADFDSANAADSIKVTASGFTLSGTDAGNYELISDSIETTARINKATIIISNIVAANREYNGGTGADVTFGKSGILAVDTDKVTLSVTGTFANGDAAADKTVSLVWSLTGDAADNYELSGNEATATADITAKMITVTATDVTATYGQDYTLTYNGDLLGNDTFTGALEVQGAAYSTGSHLKAGSYTIGQGNLSAGSNYDITFVKGTLNVNKADLTVSTVTAADRAYNGTTSAELTGATYTGLMEGDVITLTGNGIFDSKNAGTQKIVTFSGLAISGADAANYNLITTEKTTTATISKATISVNDIEAAITEQTYDGKTAVQSATLTVAGVGTDGDLTVNYTSGAFNSANVKDVTTATFSGLSLANSNYQLSADTVTVAATGMITAKDVTLAWEKADAYTYTGKDQGDTVKAYYTDVDNKTQYVTVTFGTDVVFRNAGDYTASAEASAADSNYKYTASCLGLTIAKAEITVSGITANGKVYDGTTAAEIVTSGAKLEGNVDGEELTINILTGLFAEADAGENKSVTGTFELTGAAKDNYELTANTFSTTATITAKEITVSGITASNKVYDGTSDATVNTTGATFIGMITGDDLTVSTTGKFGDKNVGTGKMVTFGALTLGGADAGNYVLADASQKTATATITAKEISINGVTIADKIYDGNTTATITGATVSGVIGSDVVSVDISGASATFANANVGTGILVNANGLALTGTDSANYKLTSNAFETTGNITKATVTVTADAQSKVYGETDPSLTYHVSGLVGSDALTGELGRDAGENVGIYEITQGTLAASANYNLEFTGADLTITKATVTVTADAQSKVYGEIDPSLTYQVSGLVGSDALTGELGRDAGENVGIYEITQGTLAASANYNLEFTGADLTITKATVTVTADAQSKVYGEADPTLTYQVSGLVGSDALTGELSRDAGENVGTYAITQGTLAASANYNLVFTGADLTITKATVTVTADAQSKVYGEADPSLTYQVSGLVGSDALTGELSRDAGENVGTYAITQGTLSAGDNYDMNFTGALFTINAKPEEPGTGSDPSTDISVNPSFNADNDASSPDYRVYGKPQREAARTAWLQDAMAPFTGGKFSVTAVEDGRRHGVELGFDATPISTSVQTHHEMYGIHDDEILDDHKVFDRYEHHVIEAQEPVSLDGDAEMDLSAAQDVMDALEDLLLEIPAVELTAKASQFHDDFDTALNDLLTI